MARRDAAPADGRRPRLDAPVAARPARSRPVAHRGRRDLVHRALARLGLGWSLAEPPRVHAARDRTRRADRHARPDRQPERGGARPHRELRRCARAGRWAVHRRRLRDVDQLRRRLGRRRVPGWRTRPRGRDLHGRALRTCCQALQGRPERTGHGNRAQHPDRKPRARRPSVFRPTARCPASIGWTRASVTRWRGN